MLPKVLWNALLVSPALLSAALIANTPAIAAEAQEASESAEAILAEVGVEANSEILAEIQAPVQIAEVPAAAVEPVAAEPAAVNSVASLEQVIQYSNENNASAQVTSVAQLTDVQPTDWAFQALQSLVERYGVIAGYPDGTYRGNRALTRFEFAAGLNAALDRVNELIAAGLADAVTREDLATLQRLQEEFAAELATLRGRVDALEARTAELEANQFSTTTVLRGENIFAVYGAFDEDDAFSSETAFGYRSRLNLDTSFTGQDRLRTRLQARNVVGLDSDPVGFSFQGVNQDNQFRLDDLFYTFPLGNRAQVLIGANSTGIDDFVASTISPLDSGGSGSVSAFGAPPQYGFAADGGVGAGAIIQLTNNISFDFGYVTNQEAFVPQAGAGLFNGDYGVIGQLTYLSAPLDAALTFIHSYADNFGSTGGPGVNNTYAGQVNFKLFPLLQIGGGVAYINTRSIGAPQDFESWSWQVTAALPDLGGEGNLLGILAGVPPYTRELGITDTSFLVEGFYRYRLNDNISLTPSVIWINDPFRGTDADDTFIGTLRTTFTF